MTATSIDVLQTSVQHAYHVGEEQALTRRTHEMIAHEAQIIRRDRRLDRQMLDYAAFGISPGVRSLTVEEPLAELGTFTYFSLRRAWATGIDGHRTVVCIVLSGYKARLANGRIEIGGPDHNVCAYDLRFRPFPEAREGGKILNSKKRTTIRMGLSLDLAVEQCVKKVTEPVSFLRLPQFWAGFRKEALPAIEDCPAARKTALEAVLPGYEGQVLPSLRSPGGKVTTICHEAEGGIGVGFDEAIGDRGESVGPARMVLLPRTAVLSPYVRLGMTIEKGAPLADFLPRRMYPSIRKIAELYGSDIADWLMEDAVAATDIEYDGLILRRAELCPTQLENADKLYEDVRPLMDEHRSVCPQVVKVRNNLNSLCPAKEEVIVASFAEVRPGWVHKFRPVLPMPINTDRFVAGYSEGASHLCTC